jgi:hypothetical protein
MKAHNHNRVSSRLKRQQETRGEPGGYVWHGFPLGSNVDRPRMRVSLGGAQWDWKAWTAMAHQRSYKRRVPLNGDGA